MTKPMTAATPANGPGDVPEVARDELGLTVEERAPLTDAERAVLADMPSVYARVTTHSVMGAQRVIEAAEQSTPVGKTADWRGAMEELLALSGRLRKNDMAPAGDMLAHQAVALQALFTRLTEMAFQADLHRFDLFMRYALRAQTQGRAAIETLAAIKNPPVVFARQANIANGPQQVNNGDPSRAHGGKAGSEPNEVSGDAVELRQDTRTPALASGADPAVAPMGAVERPQDRGGEGALVAKRVERGRQAGASGSAKRPAAGGRTPPADTPLTK